MAYRKEIVETYGAYETSPTPFTTQSLNGLVVISDRPFTPLAFRKPQSDVTGFAIGVSFVHCEAFKVSIPTQSELSYNNKFSETKDKEPRNTTDEPFESVGRAPEGERNGSPHSAQKKCCV